MRHTSFSMPYPPSTNRIWRRGRGRTYKTAAAREYETAAAGKTDVAFGDATVSVQIALTPPDRRRRDIDNPIKTILDAIVHAGILDDDSQVVSLRVDKKSAAPPGQVWVVIDEVE